MVLKSEAQDVHETLPKHPQGKCGYVVYRCVYGDDEKWARFVKRLDDYCQGRLQIELDGDLLKGNIVWDVRDNKAELDGASKDDVRKHFNRWVESVNGIRNLTMYTDCIYADEESVTSVLNGPDPYSTKPDDISDTSAFVKVLDWYCSDEQYQFSAEEIPDDEEREFRNAGEGEFPSVEGCKRFDVGWMKVAAGSLIPRAYNILSGEQWLLYYLRPPHVQDN